MGLRRYRNQADDVNQADEDLVDNLNRADLMEEKGDKLLFELFVNDREHKNGQIKPYLEHDALEKHLLAKDRRENYEREIKERTKLDRVAKEMHD